AWPGELALDVDRTGGRFELALRVDRKQLVRLPGSAGQWPADVRVEGRLVPVLEESSLPAVLLDRGTHLVEGKFIWQEAPEGLDIPPSTARVVLSVDGRPVVFPKRDGARLWLRATSETSTERESVSLDVMRRLADGVPMLMTTRLLVRAAGRAREHTLKKVLVAGSVPLSLTSELPARFESDGSLLVELRAGTHTIEIVARVEGPRARFGPGEHAEPWPDHEIWVFEARPELREVELSGAPSVDPTRTSLAEDWRSLPAFRLSPKTVLVLRETRRGEASPPPNQLTLARTLWLDLDGGGFTVRDEFTGRLRRDWRLDLVHGELGRVSVDGVDRLITLDPERGRRGVELREAQLSLVGESRLERHAEFSAVGWSEDVQSLSARLQLPPGWRLFAATGVDSAPGTWFASWDLFALFFVLVVALAVARLSTPAWGVATLAALVLCHGESGAPKYVFIGLLGGWALLSVIPRGRARSAVRLGWFASALTFGVLLIDFSVDQVRHAIYPQIDAEAQSKLGLTFVSETKFAHMEPATAPVELAPRADTPKDEILRLGKGMPLASLGREAERVEKPQPEASKRLDEQDPKAVIQTGPGLPTWSFREWTLGWSGPVNQTHGVRLFLISPGVEAVLSFVRIVLLALVGWHVLRRTPLGAAPTAPRGGTDRPRGKTNPKPNVAAATGAVVVALALSITSGAGAAVPDSSVLDDLKSRLLRPPACDGDCVSISEATLAVEKNRLRITLEVHAGARADVKLPGPATSWVSSSLEVDGKPSHDVALLDDGFLHLRVEPGRHAVVLSGPIAGDELTLAFEEAPHRVRVEADGWDVDGVRQNGTVAGSVRLYRRLERGAQAEPGSGALPAWFELERHFEIGVRWTVRTVLRRVSPASAPVVVRVPLLDGESVTEANMEVERGELVVPFGRDESQKSFASRLEPAEKWLLTAPKKKRYSEVWILDCGIVWACSAAGVPPVERLHEGRFRPLYRPWPGETLSVAFERPAGAPGASTTIDGVELRLEPGRRLLDASLAIDVRSSSGGAQSIRLPEGSKLTALRVNGQERAAELEGQTLRVSLGTGHEHIQIEWRQALGLTSMFSVPEIDLGRPAANVRVSVGLPRDRWLLFTTGPRWGPAILFWGYLGVVLLAAIALSRFSASPLRLWQWALLGIGLTQVPAPAALFIGAWFFAVAFRKKLVTESALKHDAVQLLLAFASVVTLVLLGVAVYRGLVVQPDMQVTGGGSTQNQLRWYLDRTGAALPTPSVLSLPFWSFRVLMLLWALWLAISLVGWLRWAWSSFATGGVWRPLGLVSPFGSRRRNRRQEDPPAPPATPQPEANRE
ncbi:MAG TPA: hypothetical protein VF989_04635, partial [Polyangiaceae bacterium]